MKQSRRLFLLLPLVLLVMRVQPCLAQPGDPSPLAVDIDQRAKQVESKVIAWRHDIHQHPELSNQETRTAKLVADHLRSLGIDVQTGIAHTGVVGLLQGGKPGPIVALRADMDALPVVEELDLPFASKVKSTYNGQEVGVMHACGHDAHTAILMGVAEILTALKPQLSGAVKFIFQPAEEGVPDGEEGGAALMMKQGVLANPKPEAMFALHVLSAMHTGKIEYRPGPTLSSVDDVDIVVHGRQTHGATPWGGVDAIVVAAQIILGIQTIESRQMDVSKEPSIVSIGTIHGGLRANIIANSVQMSGTIRAYDEAMRQEIQRRMKTTAEMIALSAGARAEVMIGQNGTSVTVNHPGLTQAMAPTLSRVAGAENVSIGPKRTNSDDMAEFQKEVPGLYFFLGITPPDTDVTKAELNHSPRFYVDESGLLLGVRALAHLTVDYMARKQTKALP